jgi:hypothetical protein
MATATKTGIRHTIERVKRAWTEMDYAQRRLFEIRTGVAVRQAGKRTERATVDELESLYELGSSAARG